MKQFRGCMIALSTLFLATQLLAQTVTDPNFRVQRWVKGLDTPTGAAFIDGGATTLMIEKNTGRVRVVKNREIIGNALDLPVATDSERGLLGIAVSPNVANDHQVFLSYTAAASDGGAPIDARVDRYLWNGSTLTFDRRVVTMPATPGPNHDGGKIAFGVDGKLYVTTGDLNRDELTQNNAGSTDLNRMGAILRVNPSGSNVSNNPFKVKNPKSPLNDIYAYGIRNSFGIAFDPNTGDVWDTENGPNNWDEINRITPGFNSGWKDIMGPTNRTGQSTGGLASLGAASHYGEPKFSWDEPVAPTDLFFMDTTRLGSGFKGDLFVGTVLTGALLKFDLTHTRKSLRLDGVLNDGVADNSSGNLLAEQSSLVFGNGFGTISDILSGPGGLYVVSLTNNAMYRISPADLNQMIAGGMIPVTAVPEPVLTPIVGIALLALARRRR